MWSSLLNCLYCETTNNVPVTIRNAKLPELATLGPGWTIDEENNNSSYWQSAQWKTINSIVRPDIRSLTTKHKDTTIMRTQLPAFVAYRELMKVTGNKRICRLGRQSRQYNVRAKAKSSIGWAAIYGRVTRWYYYAARCSQSKILS